MTLTITKDVIILDASCIINLYATGYMEEILHSIPQSITVAAYVFDKEALWIKELADDAPNKKLIDLQPLIVQKVLTVVEIESEAEFNLHVQLSTRIRDEGEARTGAIAIHRNWAIALDDRKARRVVSELSEDIELVYSLELIKYWVDTMQLNRSAIELVLDRIRRQATYLPRKANPLYYWWIENGGANR